MLLVIMGVYCYHPRVFLCIPIASIDGNMFLRVDGTYVCWEEAWREELLPKISGSVSLLGYFCFVLFIC